MACQLAGSQVTELYGPDSLWLRWTAGMRAAPQRQHFGSKGRVEEVTLVMKMIGEVGLSVSRPNR